jgi:para-nitrobenzyl esterase
MRHIYSVCIILSILACLSSTCIATSVPSNSARARASVTVTSDTSDSALLGASMQDENQSMPPIQRRKITTETIGEKVQRDMKKRATKLQDYKRPIYNYPDSIRADIDNGVTLPLENYPIIPTDKGSIRGFIEDDVAMFLGVPYAAPPIGINRYTIPKPVASWNSSGIRDTRTLGNICPNGMIGDIVFGDEDCLSLEVYVPAGVINNPNAEPVDVMVWMYGGGYVFGDSYEFGLYDAKHIVKKHNVIVVAMNYRLGPFGFFAHPSLASENPYNTTGNYGVQDQQYALQWVQRNIRNFNGNSNQVTIFGESAGAFSIIWHLVSPQSKGLFQAAIFESGTADSPSFFQPPKYAFSFYEMYADAIGCNATETGDNFLYCLRNLTTAQTMTSLSQTLSANWPHKDPNSNVGWMPGIAPLMPNGPCIDGSSYGLLDMPINLIRQGRFMRVPTIGGSNQNEGSIFVLAMPIVVRSASLPLDDVKLETVLGHFFNASTVQQVMQVYPAGDFGNSDDDRASRILRDFFFACPTRDIALAYSKYDVPFWMYHFAYKGDWIEDPFLGDYHSSELEFVFDNAFPPLIHAFSERDDAMAETFGYYWTNLAKTLNPNGSANSTRTQPLWPTFDPTLQQNVRLADPVSIERDYTEARCEFWDTVEKFEWHYLNGQ